MAVFDDLMRKQAEVAAMAAMIATEKDAARIQQLTSALQREAQGLQQMALAFEQQQQAKHGLPPAPVTALTPEQQQIEMQRRTTVEKLLAEIEKVSPAAAEAVARLRADPNFLGGVLAKK